MRRPPILFSRPSNEWINQVTEKHKRLAALQVSGSSRDDLKRWAESKFVSSVLRLENREASEDTRGAPPESAAAAETLRSLGEVESLIEAAGAEAALTPELLSTFGRPIGGEVSEFRKGPAVVENACRWFTADSFAELNPVEQAAIACLRILEIEPFEGKAERTALLSASLFTLRATLPPVIIEADHTAAFRAAVQEGLRMDTRPMVELIGEAIARALDEMLRIAEA